MTISLPYVSWIDPVFCYRTSHLWVFREEDVTVIVEVPHDRSSISLLSQTTDDLWGSFGSCLGIDSDTDDLRSSIGELYDLSKSRFDIASRSIRHRLDDDRMIRSTWDVSDHDGMSFST